MPAEMSSWPIGQLCAGQIFSGLSNSRARFRYSARSVSSATRLCASRSCRTRTHSSNRGELLGFQQDLVRSRFCHQKRPPALLTRLRVPFGLGVCPERRTRHQATPNGSSPLSFAFSRSRHCTRNLVWGRRRVGSRLQIGTGVLPDVGEIGRQGWRPHGRQFQLQSIVVRFGHGVRSRT